MYTHVFSSNKTAHRQTAWSHGFLLITVMAGSFFISLLVMVTTSLAVVNYRTSVEANNAVHLQLTLDAAVSQAMVEIQADANWPGVNTPTELNTTSNLKTTYTTAVATDSPTAKRLTITAFLYKPSTSTTPTETRKLELTLQRAGATTSTPLSFAVVTGTGGLALSSSAQVLGGDLYVNGSIEMSNTASIGSASNPVRVFVAHSLCPIPANATYPRVCGATETAPEPIAMTGSSWIYGEVRATNQTNGSRMSNPGLIAGESSPPAAMPSHDRTAVTSSINSTMTGSAASCNIKKAVVWPAHVKITGDVSTSGSCSVEVEGDAWITGDLSATISSTIKVKEGLTEPPTIMIDGNNGFSGSGSAKLQPNSDGIGFNIITYYAQSACNPGCTSLAGVDLYNSRTRSTIALSNSFSAPATYMYARWSKVTVSNAGLVGSLAGQLVDISSAGSVVLDGEVDEFDPGGGAPADGNWKITSYKRLYN